MIINEAFKQGVLPTPDDIKSGRVTIDDITRKVRMCGSKCGCKRKYENLKVKV